MRLLCDTRARPAKVAVAAKAGGREDRPALATFAALAGHNHLAAFSATSVADDFAERAAIIEEGAKVPRAWAEGFAMLEARPVPRGVDARAWLAMMDAAGRFLDRWGSHAAALGWSAAELFGLDERSPMARRDLRGAAFFLADADVLGITSDAITLRVRGSVHRIPRRRGFTRPAWSAS